MLKWYSHIFIILFDNLKGDNFDTGTCDIYIPLFAKNFFGKHFLKFPLISLCICLNTETNSKFNLIKVLELIRIISKCLPFCKIDTINFINSKWSSSLPLFRYVMDGPRVTWARKKGKGHPARRCVFLCYYPVRNQWKKRTIWKLYAGP